MATDEVEIYKGRRGLLSRNQWRARVRSENRNITFVSAEGYNNLGDLERVVARMFPGLPRKYL